MPISTGPIAPQSFDGGLSVAVNAIGACIARMAVSYSFLYASPASRIGVVMALDSHRRPRAVLACGSAALSADRPLMRWRATKATCDMGFPLPSVGAGLERDFRPDTVRSQSSSRGRPRCLRLSFRFAAFVIPGPWRDERVHDKPLKRLQ